MATLEKVLGQFKVAKARRSQWEDLWEEIYELMLPMQEGFFDSSIGEENMDLIYDETAIVSIQQFASRLQSGLIPNFSDWFRLIPGVEIPVAQRAEFQAQLDDISRFVLDTLRNTNFSQASVESFLDLAVGTGNMLVQEDNLHGRLIDFNAVSQPHVYILPGPGGIVDRIFRVHNLEHLKDAKQLWPKATFSADAIKKMAQDKCKATVIESVMRNWQERGDETWEYDVVLMKEKEKILSEEFKGAGSNPWLIFRWSNRPGEVYGRGPAVLALPAARVANLVTKLTMENADIQIGGIWQVDDDGTVNTDTIEIASGTVIPRTPGSNGLESIAPGGRIEFGDLLLSRTQEHIRDIFFNENLGDLGKTPISATEAAIRTNKLAEVMGSSFGRLQYEYVTPLIQRIIYILKEAGKIEIPKVNGREIAIASTSPLARGMKFEKIQNMTNFYGTLAQMLGPQQAQIYVKADQIVADLADNFEVPTKILTTDEERKQGAAELGQAAAEAENQIPGGAQNVIDIAGQLSGG